MRSVSLAWQILRHMGPGWCAYRAYYAVARRSGALARRIPATAWEAAPLPRLLKDESLAEPEQYLDYRRSPAAPAFLFKAADRQRYQPLLAGFDDGGANPIDEAEAILDGRLRFFSCHRLDVGFPPDWHRNHLTGQRAPTASHWSRISATGYGDIKCIWELSRFAWAYTLVRAYWRTGDERYPEAFWRLFEDWRAHNPPNTGPNWMCGQEVALRLMASCFALYGLLDSCTTTPERVALLGQFAAVSAHRVRAHIGYALSQRNNHGISEAMGLWTAGLLFPEFSQAAPWRRLGGRLLEREALRLIYDDGSCSQHSVIYQRLMLHDYLWSIVLGAANGQPLSLALQERVRRAGELLYQLQDDESGEVPLYGSSDGALILPLSNGGYRDFRPVVQSTAFLTRGERRLPPGPWDEESLWLWGPSVLEAAGHLPSGVTDQPSLTPTMPSSAPPSRACHGEAERSRAEPRGRVAEGREGGTQEAIARPSITPYPPTCPLTPSPACAAAGEGARRPGGGHYIISQPHPQQPATPAFSPLPSGRGAGGEGAGGGHLPPSVTDQPLPTPPLPSSLPSPACAAAGEGGRRPGGGHLPSDAPCPPSADPAVPAESLPSPACAAAGEGGRRPGGGHLCSAITDQPSPTPTMPSSLPSPACAAAGEGGRRPVGGHLSSADPDQPSPIPPMPSSLPSPACEAAGEGGRRPGGGHSPSDAADHPSPTPPMPSSLPSPACAAAGEGGRRPGGGHLSSAATDLPSGIPAMPSSAPPSRARPRGRVAEGREGGTEQAVARPSITPYPPTCPLTPSPACGLSRHSGAKPGAAGEGGRGPGGGHLCSHTTDQPLPTPPMPSSLPSPACAAAGEGGRRPGGGHLCSAATEHSTEPSPPPQPTVASTPRTDLHAATRGYYTLRTDAGFAFMRCGDHAPGHRPGQQDQLHVDIWWRGQNIAVDGGTYSYNPPEPWGHDFALAAMHNTVDVDGRGQSDRVSGFLSLPWAKGRLVANLRSSHGGLAYLEGELDAYLRLADPVRYRRAVVRVGEEHWLVLDRLIGTDEHTYRLHWLLGDWPYEWLPDEGRVLLHTPSGPYQVRLGCLSATPELQLVRAEEESAQGWHAPHYLDRWAALSLSATVEASGCTFWSLLGPPEACVSAAGSGLEFTVGQRTVTAVLHQAADAPIVRTLRGRPPRPTTRGNGAP